MVHLLVHLLVPLLVYLTVQFPQDPFTIDTQVFCTIDDWAVNSLSLNVRYFYLFLFVTGINIEFVELDWFGTCVDLDDLCGCDGQFANQVYCDCRQAFIFEFIFPKFFSIPSW